MLKAFLKVALAWGDGAGFGVGFDLGVSAGDGYGYYKLNNKKELTWY